MAALTRAPRRVLAGERGYGRRRVRAVRRRAARRPRVTRVAMQLYSTPSHESRSATLYATYHARVSASSARTAASASSTALSVTAAASASTADDAGCSSES